MPARDMDFSLFGPLISYKEQCYGKLATEKPTMHFKLFFNSYLVETGYINTKNTKYMRTVSFNLDFVLVLFVCLSVYLLFRIVSFLGASMSLSL